jgi:hypothetical protein
MYREENLKMKRIIIRQEATEDGTVTATPGTADAERAHKLLSGYGAWDADAQGWEVFLTAPQARRIRDLHGERITLERIE